MQPVYSSGGFGLLKTHQRSGRGEQLAVGDAQHIGSLFHIFATRRKDSAAADAAGPLPRSRLRKSTFRGRWPGSASRSFQYKVTISPKAYLVLIRVSSRFPKALGRRLDVNLDSLSAERPMPLLAAPPLRHRQMSRFQALGCFTTSKRVLEMGTRKLNPAPSSAQASTCRDADRRGLRRPCEDPYVTLWSRETLVASQGGAGDTPPVIQQPRSR